jgi:hypothetical protein
MPAPTSLPTPTVTLLNGVGGVGGVGKQGPYRRHQRHQHHSRGGVTVLVRRRRPSRGGSPGGFDMPAPTPSTTGLGSIHDVVSVAVRTLCNDDETTARTEAA